MPASAKVMGLQSLERKLKRLPDSTRNELRSEMEGIAQRVVDHARSLAPRDDGDLQQSIDWTWGQPPRGSISLGKVKSGRLSKDLTISIFAGNSEAFYARWVEFGTAPHINGGLFQGTQNPGMPAQPYFFPAWRAQRRTALRDLGKAVRKAGRKSK